MYIHTYMYTHMTLQPHKNKYLCGGNTNTTQHNTGLHIHIKFNKNILPTRCTTNLKYLVLSYTPL
jgi:hypothetical protein